MPVTLSRGPWSAHVAFLCRKIFQVYERHISKFFWSSKPSLNIKKKILRQLARGRLPNGDRLVIRHDPSDDSSALCGGSEDFKHIFSTWVLPSFMLEWHSPKFGRSVEPTKL